MTPHDCSIFRTRFGNNGTDLPRRAQRDRADLGVTPAHDTLVGVEWHSRADATGLSGDVGGDSRQAQGSYPRSCSVFRQMFEMLA
ncbi:hypothetical protein GCM10018966_003850 [Streptomyces yanii]